jgi:hypothetical protein
MSRSPEATFLGIPSEIRVKIYHYVLPSGCMISDKYSYLHALTPLQYYLRLKFCPGHDRELQLVCKLVYQEITPMFAHATEFIAQHEDKSFDSFEALVPKSYAQHIETLFITNLPSNVNFKRHLPKLKVINIGFKTGVVVKEKTTSMSEYYALKLAQLRMPVNLEMMGPGVKVFQGYQHVIFRSDGSHAVDAKLEAINVSVPG